MPVASRAVLSKKTCTREPAANARDGVNMTVWAPCTCTVPEIVTPFSDTCMAPGNVDVIMGTLRPRVICVLAGTLDDPLAGVCELTKTPMLKEVPLVNWLAKSGR